MNTPDNMSAYLWFFDTGDPLLDLVVAAHTVLEGHRDKDGALAYAAAMRETGNISFDFFGHEYSNHVIYDALVFARTFCDFVDTKKYLKAYPEAEEMIRLLQTIGGQDA
jgi:hypothetical protein